MNDNRTVIEFSVRGFRTAGDSKVNGMKEPGSSSICDWAFQSVGQTLVAKRIQSGGMFE
jgi:hypothetical protein